MKYLVKNKAECNKLLELLNRVGKYEWVGGGESPLEYVLIMQQHEEIYIRVNADNLLSFGSFDMNNTVHIPQLVEIEDIEKNSDGIFEIIYSDKSLTLTTDEIYEFLAVKTVKYSPIQLPKAICNILDNNNIKYAPLPFTKIEDLLQLRDDYPALNAYCFGDEKHQELLLDALRYGWEPLPEQLYYIKILNDENNTLYINKDIYSGEIGVSTYGMSNSFVIKFTMDEIKALDERFVQFAVKVED